MKIWHRLHAWVLHHRIRRQHRELAKYVRRSTYEIMAWKEDIAFLEEQLDHHRSFVDGVPQPNPDKVVPTEAEEPARHTRPNGAARVFPDLSLSVAAEGTSRRASRDWEV